MHGAITIPPWELKKESGSWRASGSPSHKLRKCAHASANSRVKPKCKPTSRAKHQVRTKLASPRASETDLRRHGWRAVQRVHRTRFQVVTLCGTNVAIARMLRLFLNGVRSSKNSRFGRKLADATTAVAVRSAGADDSKLCFEFGTVGALVLASRSRLTLTSRATKMVIVRSCRHRVACRTRWSCETHNLCSSSEPLSSRPSGPGTALGRAQMSFISRLCLWGVCVRPRCRRIAVFLARDGVDHHLGVRCIKWSDAGVRISVCSRSLV